MNFLKKLFGKKNTENKSKQIAVQKINSQQIKKNEIKKMFLIGWEVKLNGERHCHDFLKTQRTSEFNAKNYYSGIELNFKDEKLDKAYELDEGNRTEKILKENEIGLKYIDYPINPILKFEDNQQGFHQLGGTIPGNISFPENNCQVPFQYLGYISKKDKNFNWLPSTIHLMCPVFLNIDKVFIDYTNPEYPVLINKEELEQIDTEYEDLNKDSYIQYKSRKFDFVEFDEIEEPMHGGVPNWVQHPDIPHCPKTGKTMKFLCQIQEGVDTEKSNVSPKDDFYRRYFDKLNFWGDGSLFVFIEPDEKTVCYFIQNT